MEYIKISTADADRLLCYLRKELEGRQKGFEMFLNQASMFADEEIKKAQINGLDPNGIIGNLVKEIAMEDARKGHEEKMKDIISFIEILTCGSREDCFDGKSVG